MEEESRVSKRGRDRELIRKERRRIIQGLDDDAAAERRYARMDEAVGRELRAMRLTFKGLDRACGTNRWNKVAAGSRITFRLKGGRLVRETNEDGGERKEEEEVTGMEIVGEPSSSSATTTAAGSVTTSCSVEESLSSSPSPAGGRPEDELCSAFSNSAHF